MTLANCKHRLTFEKDPKKIEILKARIAAAEPTPEPKPIKKMVKKDAKE